MHFNLKDFKRFEKQIILKNIGINGQKIIFKSKVLIVGIGGLGQIILQAAKNFNIKNIIAADVSEVALKKAKEFGANIKIKILTYKKKISSFNINSIIKSFDIVCDGTDSYETRYLINDQCKKNKKILISAAISKFDGHLYKFNFSKKGSCYRCFMPEKPSLQNDCQTEGIFSPVAGVLGSLQANEVLKTILGLKDDLNNRMIIFDSIKTNFRRVKLSINPNCKNKCV